MKVENRLKDRKFQEMNFLDAFLTAQESKLSNCKRNKAKELELKHLYNSMAKEGNDKLAQSLFSKMEDEKSRK